MDHLISYANTRIAVGHPPPTPPPRTYRKQVHHEVSSRGFISPTSCPFGREFKVCLSIRVGLTGWKQKKRLGQKGNHNHAIIG